MTTYGVIVSELAEADIAAVFEYLVLRSPDAAADTMDGIEQAIASLSEMPKRCTVAPDNDRLEYPMRQLIYRHRRTAYRILFSVFEAEGEREAFVRVLRVRHGGQQQLGVSTDGSNEN